ncbi:hypothetical protein M431DRAFT_546179 [Trichoderma harzianum CBS 226.95]|uniref:Peptidase S8/S53 domain-containing protein n=1 Tax=Trichoderma harzianum CBS 226.95 TaxID=983964 RepID=A0A2T3ZVM3_TRIHA|nr:hypothetical protein M431DRAFT_546179 [Trichoderma harzianum CBS 226.95]PTB48854.1 hypothetical protein M431DRAFT_546179 [Trichoderma harzianum CBS 226.95]
MDLNKEEEKKEDDIEICENDERNRPRVPIIDRFQQMLDESQTIEFIKIKEAGKKYKSKDSKAFLEKYTDIIGVDQKSSTEGCVLHRIAKARIDDVGEKYASLIEWCATEKMLLSVNITSNYNPLHTALSEGNHSFVDKMIQIAKGKSRKIGAKMISATTHSGHNCFHLAIDYSSKYTIDLISLYREYTSDAQSTETKAFRQRVQTDHQTPLHLIMDRNQTHVQQYDPEMRLNVVKALIEADPESLECRTKTQNLTPYQYRLYFLEKEIRKEMTAEGQNSSLKSRKNEREIALQLRKKVDDDDIASYIRMFCISRRSRDEALKALYPPGQERNIDFDLSGLRDQSISVEYLDNLATHLQFESVLKYVALPKLVVNSHREDSKDKKTKGRGLRELTKIFDWLRQNHVNKVIKVIVVDDGDISHSDSAIRDAVSGLDIQYWDWKKTDICSDVILDVAPDVKEVALYSSGNNAVLLGWSSPDGFPKFQKGLEDPIDYVQQFKEKIEGRLNNQCSHCKVAEDPAQGYGNITVETIREDETNPVAAGFRDAQPAIERNDNEWMAYMKNFAIFLRNIKGDNLPEIKIAVIDSGIDATLNMFKGRIALGKSFCRYQDSEECISQYYVPADDHGTKMAYFICQVFPKVRLYIARLDSVESSHGKQQFTAKSAAEAIKWSIECGVDIISMSWTIESNSVEGGEIKQLKDAISLAESKNILMFCSADDKGAISSDRCYPNAWKKSLLIGAANETGSMCDWVPAHQSSEMFIFPGLNIPFSPWIDAPDNFESGSSVATAIAAGLAGVLLFCDALIKTTSEPNTSQIIPSATNQLQVVTQSINTAAAADDDSDDDVGSVVSDDESDKQQGTPSLNNEPLGQQSPQQSQSEPNSSYIDKSEPLNSRGGMERALSNLSDRGRGKPYYPRPEKVLDENFQYWSWKLHRAEAKEALAKFMTTVKVGSLQEKLIQVLSVKQTDMEIS